MSQPATPSHYFVTSRISRWVELPGRPRIREVIELRMTERLTWLERLARAITVFAGVPTSSLQHIDISRWDEQDRLIFSETLWYLVSDEAEVLGEDYQELSEVTDFDIDKLRYHEKTAVAVGYMRWS